MSGYTQGPWGEPTAMPPGGPAGQYGQAGGPAPQPPKNLQLAITLMYVGAGLGLLGMILGFAMTDELKEQVAEDNPSLSADQIDSAVSVGLTIAVFVGLLGIGLWIWMAIMNGQGKSWARVTGTVFGCFNVVGTLINLAVPGRVAGAGIAVSIASGGLAVIIMILMYQRDSSEYYRVMSTPQWMSSPYAPGPGPGPGPGAGGPWGSPPQY